MSKIEVNAIEPQCGTDLTVGASGDTITFPTGTTIVNNGSQTGFGRTGTVDWNTTPITSTPTTGANGIGYFIDASGGVRTINLPASPSAGDIMAISDYAQISKTNNITIGRNGSNIQGSASDLVIARNGVAFTLVYVDVTKGWVVTDTGAEADKEADPEFITATGGTITTVDTDYKVHTFTGPGTFTVFSAGNSAGSNTIDYLVVAGGASGGARNGGTGAGGAGGLREGYNPCSYTASPLATTSLPVAAQGYPITVGGGGAKRPSANSAQGVAGSNSIFSSITSAGGGGGGAVSTTGPIAIGANGGSGGGAGIEPDNIPVSSVGAGNTPPVSPSQGNPGGNNIVPSWPSTNAAGGGGGGAGAAGGNASSGTGGTRGCGVDTGISGSSVNYAQGGGAVNYGSPLGGLGGNNPASATDDEGVAGGINKGGGGGAGGSSSSTGGSGAGGSGIVLIRYKFQ